MTKNLDALIQSITDEADQAIAKFNSNTDQIQKSVYDRILRVVKDLKLTGGKLAKTGENVRAISKLKADILSAIQTDQYVAQVADFAKAFNTVTKLQNQYFSALVKDFKPAAVLKDIRNDAVDLAVESLTDTGLEENLVKPVQDLIRTSVNSGGSYADLSDQIKNYILGESKVDGALVKYAGQITTDSINTYSATYHDLVSEDLGLEWFMFTGSMLTTSRPMCVAMNDIKFFHVSQIPELLKGIVNGVQTPVNKKTGLPNGFRANTTVSNYMQVRNGYRCGHQFVRVTESMVPQDIRNAIKNKAPVTIPAAETPASSLQKLSLTQLKEKIASDFKSKTGMEVKDIQVHPKLTRVKLNKMVDHLSLLLNEYNVADGWIKTARPKILFVSDRDSYGWLTPGGTADRYIADVSFGHKADPDRIRPFERNPRKKSKVDAEKLDVATVTHEFAHVIAIARLGLSDKKVDQMFTALNEVMDRYLDTISKLWSKGDMEGLEKNHLGHYARTNLSEFMAEGFTEYKLSSNPSPFAVEIGKLVDKYFKK